MNHGWNIPTLKDKTFILLPSKIEMWKVNSTWREYDYDRWKQSFKV